MAKKKKQEASEIVSAPIREQLITDTLEKNYMPYVMSVIISRAIPEIDGFKPLPPEAAVYHVQNGIAQSQHAPNQER